MYVFRHETGDKTTQLNSKFRSNINTSRAVSSTQINTWNIVQKWKIICLSEWSAESRVSHSSAARFCVVFARVVENVQNVSWGRTKNELLEWRTSTTNEY